MKRLLALLTIIITSCSTADFYGDVDLGGNLYFIVDPSFNSVDFATGPTSDPMRTALPIINHIESVGFNDKCILVVSKVDDNKFYWVIDKTQATAIVNTPNDSLTKITNLKGPLDSIEFNKLKTSNKILLISAIEYRKKFDYK